MVILLPRLKYNDIIYTTSRQRGMVYVRILLQNTKIYGRQKRR